MWKKRDVVRAGGAIVVSLAGWVLIRLVFPSLNYYPPESLVRDLGPSRFAAAPYPVPERDPRRCRRLPARTRVAPLERLS